MRVLNAVLGTLVDVLLYPFRTLPPIVGLAAVAILTSVVILLIFRATSDQKALKQTKGRITAAILEIRLFKDDPLAIMRAQVDVLRHSLTYMRLSLIPMLWVILPLVLLLIQLQFRYGYERLAVGSDAIVSVRLRGAAAPDSVSLIAGDGMRVNTPMLFIPSRSETEWRISPSRAGEFDLRVRASGSEWTKRIDVGGDGVVVTSPRRPSNAFTDQLLYPVEPPVPGDAPIEAIEITYPAAGISLLGWKTHWMVVFFVLTIVFAFALQKPLKVTI